MALKASRTSSSLNGLTMAVTIFMVEFSSRGCGASGGLWEVYGHGLQLSCHDTV
jgi:hypothetical protein